MRKLILSSSVLLSLSTIAYPTEQKYIASTIININDFTRFIDSLTTEELLAILSIGKVKQIIEAPHIAQKLQELQNQIDVSLEMLYTEQLSDYNLSQDTYANLQLIFQQKMALLLYTSLYTKAQERITLRSDPEQQVVLKFQLTPQELENYLSQ